MREVTSTAPPSSAVWVPVTTARCSSSRQLSSTTSPQKCSCAKTALPGARRHVQPPHQYRPRDSGGHPLGRRNQHFQHHVSTGVVQEGAPRVRRKGHLGRGENQHVAQAAQERHLVLFGSNSKLCAGVNFRESKPDDRRSKRERNRHSTRVLRGIQSRAKAIRV